MRKNLPGPFTFILKASNQVPKMLKNNRRQVGIRVPNSPIVAHLLEQLDAPIMSTSISLTDAITPYPTDPEEIYEQYKHQVDLVIDGGFGGNQGSTIIDCTESETCIVREGLGILQE
jgi:tRNA threonylcarbamoyl adenosine modification protein (Sua5/YciO/YrdC/YwlC family)